MNQAELTALLSDGEHFQGCLCIERYTIEMFNALPGHIEGCGFLCPLYNSPFLTLINYSKRYKEDKKLFDVGNIN
jgi:hypothetical protein